LETLALASEVDPQHARFLLVPPVLAIQVGLHATLALALVRCGIHANEDESISPSFRAIFFLPFIEYSFIVFFLLFFSAQEVEL
jgi:hypothetical protein